MRGSTPFSRSMKEEINSTQKKYLLILKKELKQLEDLGKANSNEWWSIAESIGEIENNL